MRGMIAAFALLLAPTASAGELVLRDSECKLMHFGKKGIEVFKGDKAEYTCVVIGAEASCHYKNLTSGKSQGEATKYEVVDRGTISIWTSLSGNIMMFIDKAAGRFQYGMTAIREDTGLFNKQCVGTFVRQLD